VYGSASRDALVEGLNPEQRQAVETVSGPLLVLAGAGSGKTRVLTNRIANLVANHEIAPYEILAITFTNRAAREMVDRVAQALGNRARHTWVMTFHAACARILRREAEHLGYRSSFSIYDAADQVRLVRDVLETELNLDTKRYPPRGIHEQISSAKNRQCGPEAFAQEASGFFDETVAKVYAGYQRRLVAAGAMDFDDLLFNAVTLLEDVPDVRSRWQRRFQHVMVDEYQDTNHAQYRIVRALAVEHRNVCVVGDPDQSIYSWRGADIRNILDFERDFPGGEVIRLEQNYRSTQRILDGANGVIEKNRERQPKRLWSALGDGEPVRVVEASDENAEARYVCGRINEELERGGSASDVAVFYRTHAQSRALEDGLRRLDISYRVVGGSRFYDRAEIKDALAYLQLVANPADDVAARRILNSPRRGIGTSSEQRLAELAQALGEPFREAVRRAPEVLSAAPARKAAEFSDLVDQWQLLGDAEGVGGLLDRILDDSGYRDALREERTVEARGRLENLEEFLGVAREYDLRARIVAEDTRELDADGDLPPDEDEPIAPGLTAFLQEMSLQTSADEDDDDRRGQVTLMTIHNAKGLEFPSVFMIGMEDNVFPHIRSLEEQNVEEERRLCYVGMTRAERSLTMVYCRERTLYGRTSANPPSMFLAEIPAALVTHERLAGRRLQTFSSGAIEAARARAGAASLASGQRPAVTVGIRRREDIPQLATGDAVRHRAWGDGIVIGVASAEEVVVRFPEQGEKRLHIAYAPIEKI
jgi:DNA helicase II / ATP-dependent DNA helicase PcrA